MHKALLLLKEIPKNKVVTYKELARVAGTSPRGVGSVMRTNKLPQEFPCYKVVAVDGSLTGYSAGEGITTKKQLLEKDGVIFDNKGRISAKSFYEFNS